MFTRLYIFEYKCNNTEDVDSAFWKFNFLRRHELVVSGQYFDCDWRVGWKFVVSDRVTKLDPWTSLNR